jgi:hypothetical protein
MKISRRAFLLAAALLGVGGAPLGYRYFCHLEADAESVVRALCDLFVPGHDDVPGALALGIDRLVVDAFRETRRGRLRLLLLSQDLADVDFLALPADAQRALVRGDLDRAATGIAPPRRAAAIDEAYRECVRRYLTSPEAWTAIRYRTPQPHGYPDYAECVAS